MPAQRLSTAKAREAFSELVSRAAYARERFVVTRHRKPMAALVPMEDLERLEALEREEKE